VYYIITYSVTREKELLARMRNAAQLFFGAKLSPLVAGRAIFLLNERVTT
jgi:hypothetical protein